MGERLDAAALKRLVTVHESGFHVLAPPTDPGVTERVTIALVRRLISVALREYQYVIVDTAPQMDERSLTVMENSDTVFMLTTLDIAGLKNLKIALETLRVVSSPMDRVRVVMNRADSKVGLDAGEVERTLGVPVVVIPSPPRPGMHEQGRPHHHGPTQEHCGCLIQSSDQPRDHQGGAAQREAQPLGDSGGNHEPVDRLSQARMGRESSSLPLSSPRRRSVRHGSGPSTRTRTSRRRSTRPCRVLGPQLYHTQSQRAELNQRVRVVLHDVLTRDDTPLPAAERAPSRSRSLPISSVSGRSSGSLRRHRHRGHGQRLRSRLHRARRQDRSDRRELRRRRPPPADHRQDRLRWDAGVGRALADGGRSASRRHRASTRSSRRWP